MALSIKATLDIDFSNVQQILNEKSKGLTVRVNEGQTRKNILESLNRIVSTAGGQVKPIKLNLDAAYLQSQIQAALKGISSQAPATGANTQSSKTSGSSSTSKSTKSNDSRINAYDANFRKYQDVFSRQVSGSNFLNNDDIEKAQKALSNYDDTLKRIKDLHTTKSLSNDDMKSLKVASEWAKQEFDLVKNTAVQRERAANAIAKVQKINSDVLTGKISPTPHLEKQLKAFQQHLGSLDYKSSVQNLNNDQLNNILNQSSKIFSAAGVEKSAKSNTDAILKYNSALNNLITTAVKFRAVNTKLAGTETGRNLDLLISNMQNAKIPIGEATREFARLRSEATQLGLAAETLGSRLKTLFSAHLNTALAMAGIHLLQNSFRQMISNVVEIDTAMTNLRKVTDATDSEYAQFLEGAASRAKAVGATMTDVINATSEFARLGYNLNDATVLGDAAVLYTNVSEYTNSAEASQSLISTMKAFGIEAKEIMTIVDKFNEVGNNFAISSSGLGEAMQRSAASLNLAGNSLDESIGLVTAANTIIQDPEVVGTWAKTLTMYLRAAKTEAEAAGIETTGMASSVSKLRDTILALTSGRVDIQIDENTFKSTFQIMREIAAVYDSMTDLDQAALLEALSGKRQANTTAALIKSWDIAEEAAKSSANSVGSATKENEKYLNSIGGKIQQFTSSFQSLSTSLISSDIAKVFVDMGTGILSATEALVDFKGSLPAVIALLSTISSLVGVKSNGVAGILTPFTTSGDGFGNKLINFATGKGFKSDAAIANQFQSAEAVEIFNAFNKAAGQGTEAIAQFQANCARPEFAAFLARQRESNSYIIGGVDAYRRFTAESNAAASAQRSLRLATIANTIATTALNTAISFGVGLLFQAAITGISNLVNARSNAIQEATQTLDQYNSKLQEISNTEKSFSADYEDYERLASGIGQNGENISLTTSEFERYNEIANKIAKTFPEMVAGYTAQGDAIIKNKGNVSELANAFERLKSAQNVALISDYDSVIRGTRYQVEDLDRSVAELKGEYSDLSKIDDFSVGAVIPNTAVRDLSKFGVQLKEVYDKSTGYKVFKIADEISEEQKSEITSYINNLSSQIASYESERKSVLNRITPIIQAMLEEDTTLNKLPKELQTAANMFAQNYFTNLYDFNEDKDGSDLRRFITGTVPKIFEEASKSPEIQNALDKLFSFDSVRSLNKKDFQKKISPLLKLLSDEFEGYDINFYKLFGFDSFEDNIKNVIPQIIENTNRVIGGFGLGKLKDQFSDYLSDLSLSQLETLNSLFKYGDEAALEYLNRIFNLIDAGADLGDILNGITDATEAQGKEFRTVSGDIEKYQKALEKIGPDAEDNHKSLSKIFDELKEASDQGQINTETAREQMKLLYGEVLSLDDLRKRIKKTDGFFTVDKDNPTKDALDSWKEFVSLYKKLPEESKKLADVNLDTKSIKVAQNDVEAFATALGLSATSLQHTFDLLSSYGDYVQPSIDNVNTAVDTLAGAVGNLSPELNSLGKKMQEEFEQGNVDLTHRINVDIGNGTYATVLSSWMDTFVGGKPIAIHFTPIVDGEFLDNGTLDTYIKNLIQNATSASDLLKRDDPKNGGLGVILRAKVGFDFDTEEKWGEDLHTIQEEYYNKSAEILNSNAWELLTKNGMTDVKIALESILGADFNFASYTVDELYKLADALSTVKQAAFTNADGVFNEDTIISGFQYINTQLDETALKIENLPDGKVSIEVTDMDKLSEYLSGRLGVEISSKDLSSFLSSIQKSIGENGKLNLVVNTEQASESKDAIDKMLSVFEHEYDLKVKTDDAVKSVDNLIKKIKEISQPQIIPITYFITSQENLPTTTTRVTSSKNPIHLGKGPIAIDKNAASGINGQSAKSGRVLVGEVGPELWIDKSGKKQRVVGKYGMEVINIQRGDAIVPTDITQSLMRGSLVGNYSRGTEEPSGIYGGINISGEWDENITSGDSYKKAKKSKKKSSSRKDELDKVRKAAEAEIATLKYKLHMELITQKQYYDGLTAILNKYYKGKTDFLKEERDLEMELFDLKKAIAEDWITDRSHMIDLIDYNNGISEQMIPMYKKIIDYIAGLGKEARARGLDDTSDYIQSLSKLWIEYNDKMKKLQQDIFNYQLDLYDQYIEVRNHLNSWGSDNEVSTLKRKLSQIEQAYKDHIVTLDEYVKLRNDTILKIYDVEQAALKEILSLTQQMIQKENEDQIDSLQKQLDKYREIIEAKKRILELHEAERNYQSSRDDLTGELSDLQKQLNALTNDDSREALVKRNELLEQMKKKQKELADHQHDYSYEQQQDALDRELESYEKEKQDEIDTLRNYLKNAGDLYQAAVKRINNNFDTLFEDLLEWNRQYGTGLDRDVIGPWSRIVDLMKQAKMLHGAYNFEGALNISQSNAENALGLQQSVGQKVQEMKSNSQAALAKHNKTGVWDKNYHNANKKIALEIEGLTGLDVTYNRSTGKWLINGEELYAKYHTGGVVGENPTLKQNEIMAVLEKGEIVFNQKTQGVLFDLLSGVKTMYSMASQINPGGLDINSAMIPTASMLPKQPNAEVNIEINSPIEINGMSNSDIISQLESHGKRLAEIVSSELSKNISSPYRLRTKL